MPADTGVEIDTLFDFPDDTDEPIDEEREGTGEEGPAHRRLIRAQLPRHEGQVSTTRPAPDFTIRQPANARPNRFRPRHQRAAGGGASSRAIAAPEARAPTATCAEARHATAGGRSREAGPAIGRVAPAATGPSSPVRANLRPAVVRQTARSAPATHMPDLSGRHGLIVGVANKRSISWAIAQAAAAVRRPARADLSQRASRGERPRTGGWARERDRPAVRRDERRADRGAGAITRRGVRRSRLRPARRRVRAGLGAVAIASSRRRATGSASALDVSAYSLIALTSAACRCSKSEAAAACSRSRTSAATACSRTTT